MPGLPVHHQLPEFTQTHVHRVSDAIQPSHSLSPSSLFDFNLPQHQSLFQWVSSSHQVAKVLEFQLQHRQEPAWGIPPMAMVMRKEARQNAKAWSSFRGSPRVFLNIYPQKTRVCLHTTTFLWKKLIQGFSLLHQLKPLWWLSNLPDRFPGLFIICELLQPPNRKRHKA